MSARTVWEGERLARLIREFPTCDVPTLAKAMGVTPKALRQAAGRAGIVRDRAVVLKGYAERGTAHLAAYRASLKDKPKAPVRFERHPLECVVGSWVWSSPNA